MKILIADDSPTIVEVLQFLLQSQGYDVMTASDGIEAIAKVYQRRPDLMLLDIEMPKMSGYHVCRLLKSDAATRTIPIIMLTSRTQKSDRFWGLSTGADEFITKDFDSEEELFTTIQKILDRRLHATPQSAAAAQQSGDNAPADQQFPLEPQMKEIAVLERVNQILDRQLFQATIVNELSYIAINLHSFPATIHSLFSLLGKVCEFQVASILVKDRHLYHLFLYVFPPVSRQTLEITKQRVIQAYSEHHPLESLHNLEVTILRDNESPDDRQSSDPATAFLTLPLKVRNNVIGVLAVGHPQEHGLSGETLETLRVFANEASIVLDNAVLFQQLEHSNYELEDAIKKLRDTQAQLVQSEKMASLGQLVAGVAHEVNTPAGAIQAATTNLIDFFHAVTDSFYILMNQKLTEADQKTILEIVVHLLASLTEERKSTSSLRQETRDLEKWLLEEGFEDVRRLAKQIVRLNLQDDTGKVLRLLKTCHPASIIGFLEQCSKIVSAANDIRLSITMITRIVNALKMYSRLDQIRIEEVDIHDGLEATLLILHYYLKHGISVKKQYGQLPKISCYANELNQVWTNIIQNALQAMHDSGTLTITTALCSETPDQSLSVTITDTGPGIPQAIQGKIFDPFFTTKERGQGTGLGLSIARQIVERHRGQIRVTSKPGNTIFEVILPLDGLREAYLAQ